jgi:transcriptional regulator with XRE-family HTH domain
VKTNLLATATRPSESTCFRHFLQAELGRRCARNPQYSLRAIANYLAIDHATISQMLRGKRPLTARAISRLGTRLGLDLRDVFWKADRCSAGRLLAHHVHVRLVWPHDHPPRPPLAHRLDRIRFRRAGRNHHTPRLDSEEFSAYQEQGWTNTGTTGSPTPATLRAAYAATYTDPNGNVTALRSDWFGLGITGVAVDALGDVVMYDVNSNRL